MSRKKRKTPRNHSSRPKSRARIFADTVDAYEETMGEGAAMALAAEQEGMDIEDAYIMLADAEDD